MEKLIYFLFCCPKIFGSVNLRSTLPVIVSIYSCERLVVVVAIAHRVSRRSSELGKIDPKQVGLVRSTENPV